MSINTGVSVEITSHKAEQVRNWPLTMAILFTGILSTLAFAYILLGISEVIEKIDEQKQDVRTSALESKKENENMQKSWTCPKCGKYNPAYVRKCERGKVREE